MNKEQLAIETNNTTPHTKHTTQVYLILIYTNKISQQTKNQKPINTIKNN